MTHERLATVLVPAAIVLACAVAFLGRVPGAISLGACALAVSVYIGIDDRRRGGSIGAMGIFLLIGVATAVTVPIQLLDLSDDTERAIASAFLPALLLMVCAIGVLHQRERQRRP